MTVILDWEPTCYLRRVAEYGNDHIHHRIEQKWRRIVAPGYGNGHEIEYEWREIPLDA